MYSVAIHTPVITRNGWILSVNLVMVNNAEPKTKKSSHHAKTFTAHRFALSNCWSADFSIRFWIFHREKLCSTMRSPPPSELHLKWMYEWFGGLSQMKTTKLFQKIHFLSIYLCVCVLTIVHNANQTNSIIYCANNVTLLPCAYVHNNTTQGYENKLINFA